MSVASACTGTTDPARPMGRRLWVVLGKNCRFLASNLWNNPRRDMVNAV
jgi:hypothetical protein